MLLYGELAGFVVVSSCKCTENLKRERCGSAASHSPRLSSPCGGGESDSNPEKCRDPRRFGGDPDDEPCAGEDLFCQREVPFVSSIEEAGGLR